MHQVTIEKIEEGRPSRAAPATLHLFEPPARAGCEAIVSDRRVSTKAGIVGKDGTRGRKRAQVESNRALAVRVTQLGGNKKWAAGRRGRQDCNRTGRVKGTTHDEAKSIGRRVVREQHARLTKCRTSMHARSVSLVPAVQVRIRAAALASSEISLSLVTILMSIHATGSEHLSKTILLPRG